MEQKDNELERIERQLKELEIFKRQKTTTKYLDWNNTIPQIKRAYDAKTFVLIIGVAGIGKTECVREFARVIDKPLYTFNFSEGAREYQFIGRTDIKEDGTTYFLKDVVPQAMEDPKGAILYLDEPNVAHAGVTIRLLGMLDDRREIWYEGQCIKAHPDFFCIASINPLSHTGTAEMSPQLLSRFPIRMTFAYPPTQTEVKIALRDFSEESSAPKKLKQNLTTAIEIAQQLRGMELPYVPSIRETKAIANLLMLGTPLKESCIMVLANVYQQWSETTFREVKELIESRIERPEERVEQND